MFKEYSTDEGDPYYPVPNPRNQELYAKYQSLAVKVSLGFASSNWGLRNWSFQEPGVTFVGRLASYKYFNMDQAILNALELFDNLVEEKKIKKKWFLYSQSYTTINVCTENKYYKTNYYLSFQIWWPTVIDIIVALFIFIISVYK